MADEVVELGAANDAQCLRLRRALRAVAGFQLILIESEVGPVRQEVLRRVTSWSERGDVPPLEVVKLPRRAHAPSPVTQLASAGHGVVALDLDVAHGTAAERQRLVRQAFQALNWDRDRLASQIAGPLVLVLGSRGLRELFEVAPDLVAWRKHSLRFVAPPPRSPPAPRPWTIDLAREYAMTRDLRVVAPDSSRSVQIGMRTIFRAIRVRAWLGRFDEAAALLQTPWVRPDERDLAWLEIAEAEMALDQGEPDVAHAALRRAALTLEGAQHVDDAIIALALCRGRAALGEPGASADARVAFSSAAKLATGRMDRAGEVIATVGLAAAATIDDDRVAAEMLLTRARALADANGESWLQLHAIAVAAWSAGPLEALDHLRQAYALACANGGPEVVEIALGAARLALISQDVDECEWWMARAWAAASPAAPRRLRAAYWYLRGMSQFRRAPQVALDAFRTLSRIDTFGESVAEAQLLGEAALAVEALDDAIAAFARAHEFALARGDATAVAIADLGIGRAMLAGASGALPEAVRRLRSAIATFAERQQPAREAIARVALGDALARTLDRQAAATEYERAGDIFDAIGESAGRDLARRKATDVATTEAPRTSLPAGL